MALSEILTQLTSVQGELLRVLVTVGFLIAGHILVKVFSTMARKVWLSRGEDLTKKAVEKRNEIIQHISYALDASVILAALLYLNTGISGVTKTVTIEFAKAIPNILSVILLGLLGFVSVNLLSKLVSGFINRVGTDQYLREMGISQSATRLANIAVKGFLYLVVIQIILNQVGIGNTFVNKVINASSYAIVFLGAGLIFWGFKDLFKNIAAGFYLKNSARVRPGEEVNIDGENGKIKEVTLFSTAVDTSSGYTVLTPNEEIMRSSIKLKRTRNDLETLDDITSYFVAQKPAFCGPASMEMALEIFGYRHDQDQIGEKSNMTEDEGEKGVDEKELMSAVEELTNNEVKTAWIGYDKIKDIGDEFKAWFNDGALIVPNFYKPVIFSDASAGHFVLAVGVEDDEVLVLDPSGENGGVYYVHKDKLKEAMAEYGHERGYIVVAPEGTTAQWRIKNDLIYADKSYYDELSKTLESRLRKILRQGRILKDSKPSSVENYLEKWSANEKLTRIWKPEVSKQSKKEGEGNEASEDN